MIGKMEYGYYYKRVGEYNDLKKFRVPDCCFRIYGPDLRRCDKRTESGCLNCELLEAIKDNVIRVIDGNNYEIPSECLKDFGPDLSGCSRADSYGCKGCRCLIIVEDDDDGR